MGWTRSQQIRLAIEKSGIDSVFPAFKVKNPAGNTYWEGIMVTNAENSYKIRMIIPPNFPDQPPKTYIVSPSPLYTYYGEKLLSLGTNHSMHTFKSENGYVKMCLYHPDCWSAEYTLISCLKKARIWLEAYDHHLATGKEMSDILGTQTVDNTL